MATWARMVLAVLVMLLPGGLVFLLGWALGRAYVSRFREVVAQPARSPGTLLKVLVAVRFQDVLREARQMSGFPAALAGGR